MKEQSSNYRPCRFCTTLTTQKKHLAFSLLMKLKKQLIKLNDKYGRQQIEHYQNQSCCFKQLIRIVFTHQLSKLAEEEQCDHKKYSGYLMSRLKCKPELFFYACERLSNRLAQKNYHLELISQQIKNVAERITESKMDSSAQQASNRLEEVHNIKVQQQHVEVMQNLQTNKMVLPTKAELQIKSMIPQANHPNSISSIPVKSQQSLAVEAVQRFGLNDYGYYTPFSYFYPQAP